MVNLDDLDPDLNYLNYFDENFTSRRTEYCSIDQFNRIHNKRSSNFMIMNMNIRSFPKNSGNFVSLLGSLCVQP